jgi:hypothetical protein
MGDDFLFNLHYHIGDAFIIATDANESYIYLLTLHMN